MSGVAVMAPAGADVERGSVATTMRKIGTVYRPDIDGLRAVAVLSVVIYHLNKAWMPGGYVGVDIFFVISGYLITRNIWSEMEDGRFSFAEFYLRRIRRIAPAFLVMTAVTLVAGALLLLPEELLALGKSALWGVFSLSNVYFWRYLDTGYFADSASEVPLLHTWSLGVEEQFYFLWPSVLLLASMVRSRRVAALAIAAAICVASFAIGEMTSISAQKFAYYMLPARAGELMVGALLALWMRKPRDPAGDGWRVTVEALATAGFGLIAWSLYALDDNSTFPGINAIYPCVGAALLMLAGGMSSRLVAWVLTPRPMVFIGLISYSLYLWHWPILAFLRYFLGEVEGPWIAGAIVAMFALAYASYRWVELPARHWRGGRLKQAIALYAAPSAVLCVMTGAIWYSGGLRSMIELAPGYREGRALVEQHTAPAYEFSYNCQLSAFDPNILYSPRCIIPAPGQGELAVTTGMLLWGDSEAAHYIGVIGQLAKRDGFRFRNATHSSCPPVFGGDYGGSRYKAGCDQFRPYMRQVLLSGAIRTVIISGAWSVYDANAGFRKDLQDTIAALTTKGVRVVIIGEAPHFAGYNRKCELRGLRIGGLDCGDHLVVADQGDSNINRYLASLARQDHQVTYLDIRHLICDNGMCSPYVDGRPVYYDSSHLSMDGSWLMGTKLLTDREARRWIAALNPGAAMATEIDTPSAATAMSALRVSKFAPRLLPAILGGYHPGFPYHVRSQHGLDSLHGPAAAVLEYWDVGEEEVRASIKNDMGRLGFLLVAHRLSGDADRLDFEKPGFPRVSINIGPLGALRPQAPKVSGIVYLRW